MKKLLIITAAVLVGGSGWGQQAVSLFGEIFNNFNPPPDAISCYRSVIQDAVDEKKFTVEIEIRSPQLNSEVRLVEYLPSKSAVKVRYQKGTGFKLVSEKIEFVWKSFPADSVIKKIYYLKFLSKIPTYDEWVTMRGELVYIYTDVEALGLDTFPVTEAMAVPAKPVSVPVITKSVSPKKVNIIPVEGSKND
ncbi:MAG: hypothetical protein COA57_07550 [Flavobacteriales bacterium]|nr:MAG: hypothetical protein COA57_07550 [Flavobacteriales bacterium]